MPPSEKKNRPLRESNATLTVPARYLDIMGTNPQQTKVVLLLHGYMDTCTSLFRRAFEKESISARLIIPNGPFPVPIKVSSGFKESYAWYFVDYEKGQTFISPSVAVDFLQQLLANLELTHAPKYICGFSQGGFLAPMLAAQLENVKAVVGIGCNYPADLYPRQDLCPVFGIHGEDDEVISCEAAQTLHLGLLDRGFRGHFTKLPGMTHQLDSRVGKELNKIIDYS